MRFFVPACPSFKFRYPVKGSGDLNITLALIAISILTLVIAYINFINFSIVMVPSRIKALTIQRVFGIGRNVQILLIALESAFFSLIAFCISLLIISFMESSPIAELFSADLSIINNTNLLITSGFIAAIIGFVIACYPAKYIASFDIIEALKGTSSGNLKTSKLRSTLITFQFTASIALIIVTLFIKLQYDYMVNYSWGIQKENIVYMDINNTGISYKSFCDGLLQDPRIIDYTLSQFTPGHVYMKM